MHSRELRKLTQRLRTFAAERDWDKFHSPKNLAMALSVEASEILEHFQWITEAQSKRLSRKKRTELQDEIGDVLNYILRLSDKLHIDPLAAASDKLRKNAGKYPVHKAKGSAKKYTEFDT
jgi:dCTP diphosphatase